jgi:hypothetical protein
MVKKKIHFKSHIRVESWSVAIRLTQLNFGCCITPDFIKGTGLKVVKPEPWKASYSAAAFIEKSHELSFLEEQVMESVLEKNKNQAIRGT